MGGGEGEVRGIEEGAAVGVLALVEGDGLVSDDREFIGLTSFPEASYGMRLRAGSRGPSTPSRKSTIARWEGGW